MNPFAIDPACPACPDRIVGELAEGTLFAFDPLRLSSTSSTGLSVSTDFPEVTKAFFEN
jgi:hypothetical protein